MILVNCWKQDCDTMTEDHRDGELIGMVICPSCNERQCNTGECACECLLDNEENITITINYYTKNVIHKIDDSGV